MPTAMPTQLDPRTLVAAATKAAAINKKNAERTLSRAKRLERRVDEALHEFGRALAKLAAPTSYHALGHRSFDALLRAHFTLSPRQADKLVAAAPAYSKSIFDALGVERADLLLKYVGRTPADDVAEELAKQDAEIDGVPISQMSVTDLEEAIRKLRPKKKVTAEERAAKAAARRAQTAARRRGAKLARVEAVRWEGKWWLEVRVPMGSAGAIGLG